MRTSVAISILALLGGAIAQAGQTPAARKALVGHWALDDSPAGQSVRDSSPNSLHGSVPKLAPGRWGPGKFGQSLAFPGGAPVDLASHAATLGKLKDFTLSMWIQHIPGPSRILFSWSDGTLARRVQVEVHDARLHFGWQNGGGWQGFGTGPLGWKPGAWYHVVFVSDSASGKTILRGNDDVWAMSDNTFGPADLRGRVTQVQIGGLNGAYPFTGRIDDVRLYNVALCRADLRALYLGKPISGKPAMAVPVAKLTPLEKDWYRQAERKPLRLRAAEEIGWARAMASRMVRDGVAKEKLAEDLSALRRLEGKAEALSASADADELQAWELYRAVRTVKRRLMFRRPEIDFDEVVFVDVPYTRGNEWQHESRYRSIMLAAHGGELQALKGLSPDGQVRKLAPATGQAALLRPDVSYDGRRVLFCMKPEAEKAYHLYEIGADGKHPRQITRGGYSDLDPVYLPDGRIAFLTSRGNVYAGCGPWAPQHTLARCDADGRRIYLLSVASEPEYSPSVLADGRLVYTRWEYNDKALNRIQSLWTMNPDGTASAALWGNQSTYPDHLGEARSIPGTALVMFNGMGHHDMYRGCLGVLDTACGTDFPHGVWKVTPDVPWPEVGDAPVPTPPLAGDYHTSGVVGGYKSPYPLSRELLLVSARAGNPHASSAADAGRGLFQLYLMDTRGNRELIYQGRHNVLYAQPLRPRKRPPVLADVTDWPGAEKDGKPISPGSFYSADACEGLPQAVRARARYLRVIECVQRNYTTGCVDGGGSAFGSGRNVALDGPHFGKPVPAGQVVDRLWGNGAILAGPAIAIASNTRLKRVLGTVPLAADGSFYFSAPPGKAVYFQLLDENHLVLQSMRSWVNLMPGERRGCVGCHEAQRGTPALGRTSRLAGRRPDAITPPPWGVKTLSYLHDIQPILDKNCAACHQGAGKARKKLDLTLRPDPRGRWGGIFPEPYITLTCGPNGVNNFATVGAGAKPTLAGNFFIWAVPYTTIPPMTRWSYKSRLINLHLHGKHNGVKLAKEELGKLIAWVDTNCHYRGLADVLSIPDPDPSWFRNWPYPPRLYSAPYVNPLYCQDQFTSPADRPLLRDRLP